MTPCSPPIDLPAFHAAQVRNSVSTTASLLTSLRIGWGLSQTGRINDVLNGRILARLSNDSSFIALIQQSSPLSGRFHDGAQSRRIVAVFTAAGSNKTSSKVTSHIYHWYCMPVGTHHPQVEFGWVLAQNANRGMGCEISWTAHDRCAQALQRAGTCHRLHIQVLGHTTTGTKPIIATTP